MILNNKIVFLIPRVSNNVIKYPIVLLNNKTIELEKINRLLIDVKNRVCVIVLEDNITQVDDDIYYFPIEDSIIEEYYHSSFKETIINNGYLDNFTENDNILIKTEIINDK